MPKVKFYSLFREKTALSELEQSFLSRCNSYFNFQFENDLSENKLIKLLDQHNKKYVFVLSEKGKSFDTTEFKNLLVTKMGQGQSNCIFVIGGADGINAQITKQADMLLSLSPLTFTSAIARFVLIEQLYRVFSSINGHPYNK